MALSKTEYQKRIAAMRAERESYIPVWTDIRDYEFPYRGRFNDEDPNDGKRRDSKIFNNRPTNYARIMAGGMMAGTASKARPWFRLRTFDSKLMEREDVRLWLDVVQRRMYEILAGSNFYDAVPVVLLELILFGTAAMSVMEDREDVVRFYPYTAGTYMIANDERRKVRTFAREFKLRADQLVARFGLENVSDLVKQAYDANTIDKNWFKVQHIIEPNDQRRPGFIDNKNMPYRSIYFENSSNEPDKLLLHSGFRQFPVMVVRWNLCDEDSYGTEQPGQIALGDAKELQSAQYTKKDAIVRTVKPPLQAPHDLANSKIMNVPGGTTFYNQFGSNGGVKNLYDTKIPLGDMNEDINQTEQRLREAYMVDLFMAIMNSKRPEDMKAAVADGLNEERMLILGPVLERLHTELFNPTIDRVYNIAEESGMFPPAPAVLKDMPIKVVYTSVLAQVQRAVGIGGIERLSGIVGQFAQFDAQVVDKVDFDQAIDEVADMLGVVPTVVRSDEAVAKIRSDRAQKEQGATALASAEAASRTAKDLTQASVGGRNLLETLTGAA